MTTIVLILDYEYKSNILFSADKIWAVSIVADLNDRCAKVHADYVADANNLADIHNEYPPVVELLAHIKGLIPNPDLITYNQLLACIFGSDRFKTLDVLDFEAKDESI